MKNLGYNFEVLNEAERFNAVESENLKTVKNLEVSYLGISWPLKAIITFFIYSPYLIMIYFAGKFIKQLKNEI